jgi:hypothetical protein
MIAKVVFGLDLFLISLCQLPGVPVHLKVFQQANIINSNFFQLLTKKDLLTFLKIAFLFFINFKKFNFVSSTLNSLNFITKYKFN